MVRKSGHLLASLLFAFVFLTPLSATNMPIEVSIDRIHLQSSSDLNFTWTSRTQLTPQALENNSLAVGDHVIVNATFSSLLDIVNCELRIWDPQNEINTTTASSGSSIVFDTYYLSNSNATYNIVVNGTTAVEEHLVFIAENVTICNFFSPQVQVNPLLEVQENLWNISWSCSDLNADDTNYFSIWISRDYNPSFILLIQNITQLTYLWNSTGWLTGDYTVRVRAFSVDSTSAECGVDNPPESYWPGDYSDAFAYPFPHTGPIPIYYYVTEISDVTYEFGSLGNIIEVSLYTSPYVGAETIDYIVRRNGTDWFEDQVQLSSHEVDFQINIDGLSVGVHNIEIEFLYATHVFTDFVVTVTPVPFSPLINLSIVIGVAGAVVIIISFTIYMKKR